MSNKATFIITEDVEREPAGGTVTVQCRGLESGSDSHLLSVSVFDGLALRRRIVRTACICRRCQNKRSLPSNMERVMGKL